MHVPRSAGLLIIMIAVALCGVWGCDRNAGTRPAGEATLVDFSNSGECQARDPKGGYPDEPPKVEVITEGQVVLINHKNAIFNCCLDTIRVELRQEERLLILTESEIVTHYCRCNCAFEVTASLEVTLPGVYWIEIWGGGALVWTGRVTVTGDYN